MKSTVYLILFRGVGGKTQLPVKELREQLTAAGFENVATYINSGNAIVRSGWNRKKVVATIAEVCRKEFGFDKAIFAPTLEEWDEVIAKNPFGRAAKAAPKWVHAALLEKTPKAEDVERVRACAVKGEEIEIVGKVDVNGVEMPLKHGHLDGVNYSNATAVLDDLKFHWAVVEGDDGQRIGTRVAPVDDPMNAHSYRSEGGTRMTRVPEGSSDK